MNFDFSIINQIMIPIVVIFSLIVGYVLKKWIPCDNKIIPTVLVVVGGILGGLISGWNIESITGGMLSGLASVGLHQAFYQFMKIDGTALTEIDSMGPDLGEDEEKIEEKEE